MVDGADLERRFCESKRGFESPSLRISNQAHNYMAVCLNSIPIRWIAIVDA